MRLMISLGILILCATSAKAQVGVDLVAGSPYIFETASAARIDLVHVQFVSPITQVVTHKVRATTENPLHAPWDFTPPTSANPALVSHSWNDRTLIVGSPVPDNIVPGPGQGQLIQFMLGRGGGDLIIGSSIGDFISTGTVCRGPIGPTNHVTSLGGNDFFRGGPDRDIVELGDDDDFAIDDFLLTGVAPPRELTDEIKGGFGADTIVSFRGSDLTEGNDGKDDLYCNGDFAVSTYAELDIQINRDQMPSLLGGPNSDQILSLDGSCIMRGGDGGDFIYGGPNGSAHFVGNEGSDTCAGSYNLSGVGQIDTPSSKYEGDDLSQFDVDLYVCGSGDDYVLDFSGLVTAFGNEGDDHLNLVDPDPVRKEAYGGDGDDVILTGEGNDIAQGGSGDDVMLLGDGDDEANGGIGQDVILGMGGTDTLAGDEGDDQIDGGDGGDLLRGGEGDDDLFGRDGDDLVFGNQGADSILGGDGVDMLFGDDEIDLFFPFAIALDGGDHADHIWGEDGNDRLWGNGGADFLYGGGDDDLIFGDDYTDEAGAVTDGGSFADNVWAASGNDLVYGNKGDDVLDGGDGNDVIFGNAGNDQVTCGDGNDVVFGDDAYDLQGGAYLDGGDGADTISGDEGIDSIYGNSGDDILLGGAGEDLIYGDDFEDATGVANSGGDFTDEIHGGSDDDLIYGNGGDDLLYGDANADQIRGGTGKDLIKGGDGDDLIYGEDGSDCCFGDRGVVGDADVGQDWVEGGEGKDLVFDVSGSFVDYLIGGDAEDVLVSVDNDTANPDCAYGRGQSDDFYVDDLETHDWNLDPLVADGVFSVIMPALPPSGDWCDLVW